MRQSIQSLRIIINLVCVWTSLSGPLALGVEHEPSEIQVEIQTLAPSSEREIQQVAEDLSAEIRELPVGAVAHVVVVEVPAGEAQHSLRLPLAVVRTLVSGAAVTWTLMVQSDASLAQALPVGVSLGVFSGGVQFHLDALTRFFSGAKTRIGRFFRWWSVETAFVTIAKVGTLATAISSDSWSQAVVSTLLTSATSMGTQGIWDVGTSELRRRELATAPASAQRRVRMISDLKMLATSAAAIAVNLAFLEHVPYSTHALIGLGVAGVVRYAAIVRSSSCRRSLTPRE